MTAYSFLGLILVWYRTRGSYVEILVMLFGQTSSPMYRWLKFGHQVLLYILSRDSDAKVSMPINDEVIFYREAIGAKYPIYNHGWAVADGLKLLIQNPTEDSK